MIELQDVGLNLEVWLDVLAEERRQSAKWGYQCVSIEKWLSYLMEEVGELAEAINDYQMHPSFFKSSKGKKLIDIKREAVQAATLACKIALMITVKMRNTENEVPPCPDCGEPMLRIGMGWMCENCGSQSGQS